MKVLLTTHFSLVLTQVPVRGFFLSITHNSDNCRDTPLWSIRRYIIYLLLLALFYVYICTFQPDSQNVKLVLSDYFIQRLTHSFMIT